MSLLQTLKRWIESIGGLHIYRSTLPHGTDLVHDLRKIGVWPRHPLIFDIGAHHGQTALRFLQDSTEVEIYCFEPSSTNYRQLQQTLAGRPSVHLWKLAFADKSGQLTLHIQPHSTTHSLINERGAIEGEQVQVDTLDAFCAREDIAKIHLCKIDTEGADFAVLKGSCTLLQERKIDFVQVETSTRKDVDVFSPFNQVNDYLIEMGYELFGIYEQQPCWTGRQSLLYFNAVYISPALLSNLPPVDGL